MSCLSERLMSRIILSSTSENSFVKVHFISTIFFFFIAISLSSTFLNSVTIVKKTTTTLTPLAWPIPKTEESQVVSAVVASLFCFVLFFSPSWEMDYNFSEEFRTATKIG